MSDNNLTNGQNWNLTETTAPTVEPVTLAEARLWVRQDFAADDSLLSALITAARRHVETFTRRAMVNTTYTMKLDTFPTEIGIPRSPLSSVTSIQYVDSAGSTQTLATSVYDVDTDTEPARIVEAFGQAWPATRDDVNAVTVTFVSGYGSAASDVPETFKTAIKMLVGHWYQSREAVAISIGGNIVEIPMGVRMILMAERIETAA